MFPLRQATKIGIFTAVTLLLIFKGAFAQTAEEAYSKGKEALVARDYDTAIAEFTKAVEADPKSTKAYNNRGLAYSRKGSYDEAISDFTKTIEISPDDFYGHILRGQAYYGKGSYDLAIADCDKIIKLDPKCSAAYDTRAKSFFMKGNVDKAWEDVHTTEKLSYQINPDFLSMLKKASGREK